MLNYLLLQWFFNIKFCLNSYSAGDIIKFIESERFFIILFDLIISHFLNREHIKIVVSIVSTNDRMVDPFKAYG